MNAVSTKSNLPFGKSAFSELYATLVSITQKVLLINDRSLVYAEKPFAVSKKKRSTKIICRKCATTMRRKPDAEKDIRHQRILVCSEHKHEV
jgi:hypothetical protein